MVAEPEVQNLLDRRPDGDVGGAAATSLGLLGFAMNSLSIAILS